MPRKITMNNKNVLLNGKIINTNTNDVEKNGIGGETMSESPIVRLAAWLYARSISPPARSRMVLQAELEHFYLEYRSIKINKWTDAWVKDAQEAREYMREERE